MVGSGLEAKVVHENENARMKGVGEQILLEAYRKSSPR